MILSNYCPIVRVRGDLDTEPRYYPGPSQPYAPSAPPPPPPPQGGYGYEPKANGERFKSKSGLNDLPFLILFVLQVCSLAASCFLALKKIS